MTESELQHRIREALNSTGRCRVVRNNVGVDTDRGVRYGLGVGSPDLVGILRVGRAFCVEVKRPGKTRSSKQRAWWRAYLAWGGLGGVATSVDEAIDLLDEAEHEARK